MTEDRWGLQAALGWHQDVDTHPQTAEAKALDRRDRSENRNEGKCLASAWGEGKSDLDWVLYRQIVQRLRRPFHQMAQVVL